MTVTECSCQIILVSHPTVIVVAFEIVKCLKTYIDNESSSPSSFMKLNVDVKSHVSTRANDAKQPMLNKVITEMCWGGGVLRQFRNRP